MDEVYGSTTAPQPKTSCILVPSKHLTKQRFVVKTMEVLLSFVAFVVEETVTSCLSCNTLYFFEFVSCTAFLFTLLLLTLLSTSLHRRVGITCWSELDCGYTAVIFLLFILASALFTAYNGGSDVEKSAAAFGFLSSAAFFLDLVLFLKTNGLPFPTRKPEPETGNEPQSEAERLNDTAGD